MRRFRVKSGCNCIQLLLNPVSLALEYSNACQNKYALVGIGHAARLVQIQQMHFWAFHEKAALTAALGLGKPGGPTAQRAAKRSALPTQAPKLGHFVRLCQQDKWSLRDHPAATLSSTLASRRSKSTSQPSSRRPCNCAQACNSASESMGLAEQYHSHTYSSSTGHSGPLRAAGRLPVRRSMASRACRLVGRRSGPFFGGLPSGFSSPS